MSSINQINVTPDYDQFKVVRGNRRPQPAHINRLKMAIMANPQAISYNPIIVNERMEVVDGQHRLQAQKELGLPIYYIKVPGLGLEDVQELNALSKPWSPLDYAKSFSELGNKHYATYVEFKNRYRLNHDVLMQYLSLDTPITGEAFKRGKLEVPNEALSAELCEALLEVAEYYDRATTRSFALAFKQVFMHPSYGHQRFLTLISQSGSNKQLVIRDQALPNDYAREIERVFNYRKPLTHQVRFI